jgi:large subunit ribosomal protein L18
MMHAKGKIRRSRKIRAKISLQGAIRLSVHRTNQHIYAQLIDPTGSIVLASASTLERDVAKSLTNGGNIVAANLVGTRIAQKALEKGIDTVAFDRSGFLYHGRIKALADAARAGGLKF